ncbi:MAG: glycosyltransferase [Verrucomicrobiota bacterium]
MTASLGLLIFGLNCYVMLGFFRRCFHRGRATQASLEEAFQQRVAREGDAFLPVITTQIALFNEMNVAERVLRACAAMEYPADRHEIQVLDDSNDETIALVDRVAAELREEGHDIQVIRRAIREGYKAGALGDGLEVARGEFVAIFDSDFVPPKDFLLRALPHLLEDPGIGLAQGRWGHLNAEDSLLTRAQALGVDGHFAIEQSARAWNHLFLNFNGTAGLWRKQAIQDAGGWQSDTLTEDMDLSYRSQLAGWRLEYVPDLVVPAELPSTFTAFKSQQFRWAKGSIQTARKVLPKVFAARVPLIKKIQSIFHLTHYLVHPLMLTVSLLALPLLLTKGGELVPTFFFILLASPLIPATLAPSLLYLVSQRTLYPRSWLQRAALIPGLMVVGFGICLSNSRAVWEALSGKKSGFIRTPKAGEKRLKNYRAGSSIAPALETMLGLYCTATFVLYVGFGQVWIAPFLLLYAAGFLLVGSASLRESLIG